MQCLKDISRFFLTVIALLTAGDSLSGQGLPAPEINTSMPVCYNAEATLSVKPAGYAAVDHVWEWAIFGNQWQEVSEFRSVLDYVVGILRDQYPCSIHCESCNMDIITSAIYNTSYLYMKDHYLLYLNIELNKYAIADWLRIGIQDQHPELPEAERAYISSFFTTAYVQVNWWVPPVLPVLSSWQHLSTDKADEVKFDPSFYAPQVAGMVTMAFRVKLVSGSDYSPYSKTQLTDIKPKPPTFSEPLTITPSCNNRATGEVKVSGVGGLLPGNNYLAILVDDKGAGTKITFTETYVTFNLDVDAGKYILKLAYNNDVLGGCSSISDLTIPKRPALKYEITEIKDESCPEKDNGLVKVQFLDGFGPHTFRLNNQTKTTQTADFTPLKSGTYTLEVTDQCYITAIPVGITINEPQPVTITSIGYSNPSCKSIPDGSITVIAGGDDGNFRYKLTKNAIPLASDSTGTSKSFTGLEGGNYIVSVSSNGCAPAVSQVQPLTPVQAVSFSTSVTPVDCFGKNNGKIDVTASGGNHSYQYSIDNQPYVSSPSFASLYTGNHFVKVKSTATNCNDFAEAYPFVGTAPKIEIGFSQLSAPTCFEKNDGKITANVTGGTGPYSYSWEQSGGFPVPGSSNTIENLYSETYRVNIRDSKNCTESKEAVLTDPPELVLLSATPTDAVCFGQKGTINVQATGGSGGYLYSNNESSGFTGSPTLNLPPGDYGIYVKDANGCLASYGETLTLTGPVAPLDFTYSSPEFNSFNIACSGDATGSLSVLASGGNGLKNDGSSYTGYTYSLAGSPNQASSLFPGLRAGSFNLKVTDGRGCIVQKQVTLTEPDPLTLNLVSSIPVKCSGDATGELIVAASGGIENTWVYSLDGTEMLTTGIFKNLQARTYEIEVMDLNGCSKNMFAAVESPFSPITIAAVKKDVSCFGEGNGEITISVTGGAGNFSYQWEKKSGESWTPIGGTRSDRTNMLPGIYRVRAADKENCFRYETSEISEPPILQITGASSEDIKCFGETGILHIAGTGGIGDYKYVYSSGSITRESTVPDIIVPAGSYSISIKDANGCLATHPSTVSITSPLEPLSFNYALSDYAGFNISCHGKEDGIINVLATGGNGSLYSGYSYSISGGIPGQENVFTGKKAGTYDITVSDARGCSLSKPVTLVEPASFITLGASSIKQPVCAYDNNGAVTLEASGGATPYTYSVNGSDFTASAEFPGLKADSYTFRVLDNNGCAESFSTRLTNIISEMNVEGTISPVKCYGENSGEINVAVSGGAKPYSYSWMNAPSTTSRADRLKTGNYTVLITDSAGCISEKMFFVNQPEKSLNITAVSSPACVGLEDGIITVTGSGGTQPYSIALGNRSVMGISSSFNAYSGNHKVYISDYNGCLAETSVNVGVKNTLPEINFMLATSRYELDTLVVIDVSVPPPDRVTWEFSPEANVIETGNNKALVKYSSAGLYPVKMTGLFGLCTYTIEKLLNIAPFDPSVLPDNDQRDGIRSVRISPNPNDGRFELKVELYTRQKVTVRIFDMSSRILFTENYPPDVAILKEIKLPATVMPGTYVLRVTSENDSRTVVFVISE